LKRSVSIFRDFLSAAPELRAQRSLIISWISVLLAGLFLYLALQGLDWAAFISSLRDANYGFVPLIFIWSSMSSWIRALRWRILLTAEKYISAQNVFWANMAGYLGNNILPARAGELIRAAYVSKENGLSVSYSLATGLVERFIDLVALVILGSAALNLAGIASGSLQDALKLMALIAIVGLMVLLMMPYVGGRLSRILADLPRLNAATKEKIRALLEQFLDGVRALHHPQRAVGFMLFTSLIWLIDGVGVIILARALHMQFTLIQSFLLLAGLGLSSAIPSTPGYIGVYQFAAVIVLQPFGISNTSAVAFVIFLQAASILIVAFWGGLAIWRTSSLVRAKT
jgi:glycosyltransferase 2 family protein